jgi:hypothetical protein
VHVSLVSINISVSIISVLLLWVNSKLMEDFSVSGDLSSGDLTQLVSVLGSLTVRNEYCQTLVDKEPCSP